MTLYITLILFDRAYWFYKYDRRRSEWSHNWQETTAVENSCQRKLIRWIDPSVWNTNSYQDIQLIHRFCRVIYRICNTNRILTTRFRNLKLWMGCLYCITVYVNCRNQAVCAICCKTSKLKKWSNTCVINWVAPIDSGLQFSGNSQSDCCLIARHCHKKFLRI